MLFSVGGAGAFYENELNADGDDPYLPLVKNKCEAAIEETITAEEFHRIRAELEKDLVPVELDWHPLETYAQNGSEVTVTRTMIIPIGLICALTLDFLDGNYGGIMGYISSLGLTADEIAKIQNILK